MGSRDSQHLSREQILEDIHQLSELSNAFASVPDDQAERFLMKIYRFMHTSPIMLAATVDFEDQFEVVLKSVVEDRLQPNRLQMAVLAHQTVGAMAKGELPLIDWGVTNGKSSYSDIVAFLKRTLQEYYLGPIIDELQRLVSSIERDRNVPAPWLNLFPADLGNVRQRVQEILRAVPQARSNDKRLIYEYLKRWHQIELPKAIFADDVPSFETIRRSRQLIQKEGLYDSEIVRQLKFDLR